MMRLQPYPQKAPQSAEDQLKMIAHKVEAANREAQESVKRGATAALNAGRLLCEAKELAAHGEWRNWLAKYTTLSERTAQLYMQFARKVDSLGDEEIAQRVSDLSFRSAMTMLGPSSSVTTSESETRQNQLQDGASEGTEIKSILRRLKGVLRPAVGGKPLENSTAKEAIDLLQELIRLLSENHATPQEAG